MTEGSKKENRTGKIFTVVHLLVSDEILPKFCGIMPVATLRLSRNLGAGKKQ